jgi:hypothetical protein
LVLEAFQAMLSSHVHHLVLVRDDRPVGLVSSEHRAGRVPYTVRRSLIMSTRASSLPITVACRLVFAGLLVMASMIVPRSETAEGNQKTITFTGTLDCGRRDGQRCQVGDTLTLWTDDLGGTQRVSIDVTWIRDSLPSMDQGDYMCLDVFTIDGKYQAAGVVPCQSADKVKKPQEKDDVVTVATPTSTPKPSTKIVIDIRNVCLGTDTGPLIATGPDGWVPYLAPRSSRRAPRPRATRCSSR